MKHIAILAVAFVLSACGTVGGLVGGAGDDLKKAGDWVKSR
jgi:predicted small secreted protein